MESTMRLALLALTVSLTACDPAPVPLAPSYDSVPTDTAVVWGGFRHDWGYNHRLNRLGNWVGPTRCDAGGCVTELAHAAASGLGSDTATWSSAATAVRAPGTGFLAGATTLEIREEKAEGSRVERTARVTVPLTGLLADHESYQVLLQGYDLMSLEDADMFRAMDLSVGEPEVDAVAGTLSFDVDLALELDCDRLECDGTWHLSGKLETDVDYAAHVMWLVVGTEADAVSCVAQSGGYAWRDARIEDELHEEDVAVHGAIDLPPGFDGVPVLGLQSLSLVLSGESHLVSWATSVRPEGVDTGAGRVHYALSLFFKQWSAATWDRANSYTTEGEAWTEGTVCALALPGAEVVEVSASGSMFWKADGGAATSDDAVQRMPTVLRFAAVPNLPTLASTFVSGAHR